MEANRRIRAGFLSKVAPSQLIEVRATIELSIAEALLSDDGRYVFRWNFVKQDMVALNKLLLPTGIC